MRSSMQKCSPRAAAARPPPSMRPAMPNVTLADGKLHLPLCFDHAERALQDPLQQLPSPLLPLGILLELSRPSAAQCQDLC
eukprot:1239859-Lingulodinium_polyedra.AAC.1